MGNYLIAIAQVGFPIVAFFFVVLRLDKTIDRNTQALNKLSEHIATCPKK